MDRRSFLGMGLTGAAGLTVGATGTLGAKAFMDKRAEGTVGETTVPFHGAQQSGIATPLQSVGTILGFNLHQDCTARQLQALLRLWSADAALMQSGRPAMADSAPELAKTPASLTITFGLAHSAFVRGGVERKWPFSATSIPAYPIDALEPRWSGGDVFVQVCANDALTVSHAARELTKDARPFATVAWAQSGAMPQMGVHPHETPRNHMGLKDGTGNPVPGTEVFDETVWNTGSRQAWFANGSAVAIRRIRMKLDLWEKLQPQQMEAAFGRYISTGAPLGGTHEFEIPDLVARDGTGAPVIPIDAHIRRAILEKDIYRRVFNYDDGPDDLGLIFIAYCADIQQYLDIQQSLAESDAINTWTTPIGSAMFAILPGAPEAGSWVGESLFSS